MFLYLNDITNVQLFPSNNFEETCKWIKFFCLRLIFKFILSSSLVIFNEIFDHTNTNDYEQRCIDNWLSISSGDDGQDLTNSYNNEVDICELTELHEDIFGKKSPYIIFRSFDAIIVYFQIWNHSIYCALPLHLCSFASETEQVTFHFSILIILLYVCLNLLHTHSSFSLSNLLNCQIFMLGFENFNILS